MTDSYSEARPSEARCRRSLEEEVAGPAADHARLKRACAACCVAIEEDDGGQEGASDLQRWLEAHGEVGLGVGLARRRREEDEPAHRERRAEVERLAGLFCKDRSGGECDGDGEREADHASRDPRCG